MDNSNSELETADQEPKPAETLEQEIERLGEHFPQIAALLRRALKFFR